MAWEGCITLGTAWQYQPTNETYKTGAHVIRLLMDTRAKGGSLLLNIGPDLDAHTYFEQKEDGLYISAMNAQRVYCGVQWRTPLVLKITEPEAAFTPMLVQTLSERAETAPGQATLSAYEKGWQALSAQTITAPGVYSAVLPELTAGVTYQYRAVLSNAMNTMKGELALLQ